MQVARSVFKLDKPKKSVRWGGFVRLIDPGHKLLDPFLFLVHHVHSFSPGEITGFPAHPHRGFETVTYIIDGGFDHGDSKGNRGRYGPGDVQWLTTGKGVLHSEMFVTDKEKPTTFNGFQLWLNLPKKLKMTEPSYQMLWSKDIPVVEVPSNNSNTKVKIKIIAGNIGEVKSSVEKSVPLSFFHSWIPPQSSFNFSAPRSHHALIYVLNGNGLFGSFEATKEQYMLFEEDGDIITVQNIDNEKILEFLLLEGQPFEEPIAHQGPFVMNTREEIRQAFNDYQMGLFGHLD